MPVTIATYEAGVIPAELLFSELRGKVEENDYFGRSTTILRTIDVSIENEGTFKPSDAVDIDNMSVLVQPGYLSLENGYVRRDDGSIFIAVYLDLGYEVTGPMFDWWFSNCDNDEKCKWMHPKNNLYNTFDSNFYATMPFERPVGHYINHIQLRELEISTMPALNNELHGVKRPTIHQTLQFEYLRPSKYFDIAKFPEFGITACILAKVYTTDPFLGNIAVGYVTYIVREHQGRSELRMRFWYGEYYHQETPENYYYAQWMNYLTSFPFYRAQLCPISLAKALHTHFTEEMTCLRDMLPVYYKECQQANQTFQQTFKFT